MFIKRTLTLVLSATAAAAVLTACQMPFSGSDSSSSEAESTEVQTIAETTAVTTAAVTYTIPKLLGLTEEEVKSRLDGVKVAVLYAYDEDYPAGQVFKANVNEGDTIMTGQDMTIYISLGHNYGNDVIGMDGEEAKNYLESHGVQVGYVSEGNHTEDPKLVGKVYECKFMGEKALVNVYANGVKEGADGGAASETTGETQNSGENSDQQNDIAQ